MEDRHAIIVNYCPAGVGSVPDLDGLPRSYAAIFDGHNGSQAADEACSRCLLNLTETLHVDGGALLCWWPDSL